MGVVVTFVALALVLGTVKRIHIAAGFVAPTRFFPYICLFCSIQACEVCCLEAFQDQTVEFTACINEGCDREQQSICSEIFEGNDGRIGCELGRDFRFAGFAIVLQDTVQCVETGLRFTSFPDILPLDQLSPENIAQCPDCCRSLNRATDGGAPLSQPDDFEVDTCVDTCANNAACLDDPDHRDRLACHISLDFLHDAITSHRQQAFLCADGEVMEIEVTDFPTVSPTLNPTDSPQTSIPTLNPTTKPTEVPTSLPTKMPTRNPSNIPSKGPTSIPTENPTKDPKVQPTANPTILPSVVAPIAFSTIAPTLSPAETAELGSEAELNLISILTAILITCLLISLCWILFLFAYLLFVRESSRPVGNELSQASVERIASIAATQVLTRVQSEQSFPIVINVDENQVSGRPETPRKASKAVRRPKFMDEEYEDDFFE